MKRIIALLLTAVMTLSVFAGCSTEIESTIYKIVTTIYPVYNWLQNLTEGAENVELTLLVGDGKDIHNYQPTAEDMVKINECNYFVYVGGESDQWVNDAADAFFRDNDSKQKVSLLGLLGSNSQQVTDCAHTNTYTANENIIQPTCIKSGSFEEVEYCSDCGVELSRVLHVTKAKGHDFSANIRYE